jgi:hypothetical protein
MDVQARSRTLHSKPVVIVAVILLVLALYVVIEMVANAGSTDDHFEITTVTSTS